MKRHTVRQREKATPEADEKAQGIHSIHPTLHPTRTSDDVCRQRNMWQRSPCTAHESIIGLTAISTPHACQHLTAA